MCKDQKRVVAAAYDQIADAYLSKYGVSSVRQKLFRLLLECLPSEGGHVLDLGCGAGLPVARDLASAGHVVFGVDISAEQIGRARANVPKAEFSQADMTEIEFARNCFDAIGAFYSFIHIPAAEHGSLFKRTTKWLKPGGTLVASLGTGIGGDWRGEWLGQPMFFSHSSEAVALALLQEAGLVVQQFEVEQQDNEDTRFLWVMASKPSLERA